MDYTSIIANWKESGASFKDLFVTLNRTGIVLSKLPKDELKNLVVDIVDSYEPHQQRMVQQYLLFYEDVYQKTLDVPLEEPEPEVVQEPEEISMTEQEALDEYRNNAKYVEDTEFLNSLGEFEGETNE
jgi:uncharacterized protein (DUF2235 family)